MTVFSSRRTLAQTSDGDIKVNALNSFEWVEGKEAVVTEIKNTLNTVLGEDPFDEEHGVDVFSISEGDEGIVESAIRRALDQMHGDDIKTVDNVTVEINQNRRAEVDLSLTLVDDSSVQVTSQT